MFTLNNPIRIDLPKDWVAHGECVGVFWSLEEAPTTGTPHLQGVLRTKENPSNKNGYSVKWVCDNIYRHMDVRIMMGTLEQAKAYCSKPETHKGGPWSIGTLEDGRSAAGQAVAAIGRKVQHDRMKEVQKAIIEGHDDAYLWHNYFNVMVNHHNAMNKFRLSITTQERNWHTKMLVLTGPPGTGKSALALEICKNHGGGYWFKKPKFGGTLWADGYDPIKHKVIVFDEFDGSVMPFEEFNRIHDRYPYYFETKGSMVPCLAELSIVISNKLPRAWWSQESVDDDRWKAAVRRMSGKLGAVKHMTEQLVIQDDDTPDFEELLPGIIAGTHDWNGLIIDPKISALPNSSEYEETSQPYVEDENAWLDDTSEEAALAEYENHLDLVDEYNAEHEGGSSYPGRVRKVVDLTADEELEAEFDAGQNALKKLKRTDSSTLGLEKQEDKRWGAGPVQSKIVLRKAGTLKRRQIDDDDDFDDKSDDWKSTAILGKHK